LKLHRSFATRVLDTDEFATFRCCGEPEEPWVLEAENYIRGFVLGHATWVLSFRDASGELIAVSAFDRRVIEVPLIRPERHEGWHLQVLAVSLQHQGRGLAKQVFEGTFGAMREIASDRVLVTANVHRENAASRVAAERSGLLPLQPLDEHYWVLLGEVPRLAQ
jgi:RimJ/RimL family protein N-acetyltransferase